jgi:hypothetical protein
VWDDALERFVPLIFAGPGEEPASKPRVIIIDARNGKVYADGGNINVPVEGREGVLRAIETADVLVEFSVDGAWVKRGVETGIVGLVQTKSEAQMSAEKAQREWAARPHDPEQATGEVGDRHTFADDPVDKKFARVWDGSVPSGVPVVLKGM